MTRKEIIDGLEIYTAGRLNKDRVHITVKELQKFIDEIKDMEQEPCEDWYDVPSDEMTLEQARQAVKDLRKKLAEYLTQEPCEDCISRQAVVNAIANTCFWLSADNWKELTKCINSISPVTPQQTRWVPVSERLPEIHQDMLLPLRSLDVEVGFRAETEPYFYCHSADGCYVEPQNVLAWRPLPKPYKKESEE